MKNEKIHIIIGSIICIAPMLLFVVFYNRLPESIPIQITMDGSAGNAIPKQLFTFGMPIAFVIVNLINGVRVKRNEKAPLYSYYVIPVVAIVLSVLSLTLALTIG